MALWQFDIEVIPAERIGGRPRIKPAEFETADRWSDRQPPGDYRERLAALLPRGRSWSEEMLLFGTRQGDRIDVGLEQGRVGSVRVRIDCRTASPRSSPGCWR
ncbi:MAG: hypothetical protein JWO31_3873 [Phycisphaerales bacterium]|nr:hypothetical protein [Phycisphaerales bacterium]